MTWHLPLLAWLAHAALGGLLVLAAGCLAVRCCRQPAVRLRLIELTLLGCLLAPWLYLLPGVPRWSAGWLAPGAPTIETAPPAPELSARLARHEPPRAVLPRAADEQDPPAESDEPDPAPVVPPAPVTEAAAGTAAAPPGFAVPWLALIVAVYGCGAAAVLLWWAVGAVALGRLCAAARPAPEWVRQLFLSVAGSGGRGVRLLVSGRVGAPITFGVWRPVVVLPEDLCRPGQEPALRFCLAHEWSHVEGGDVRRWHLATLVQFVCFFQPLYWWVRRQLRLCQDYLADARAATQAPEAEDYAEFLVGLARRQLGLPLTAALGMADKGSNLYRRVVMLLNTRQPLERRCRGLWNLAACLGIAALLAAVAAVRLDAADTKTEPTRDSAKKDEPKKDDTKKPEALNYTGKVADKETGKPIEGAVITVRRSVYGDPEVKQRDLILQETKHKTDKEGKYSFTIPPEQVAQRYLYIELDAEAPGHAPQKHFGYALSMILKNEKMGGRPFFEDVKLWPAKEVTGTLHTPDSKPAVGVKLLAYSNTNRKGDHFEYGSFADGKTDDKGRFSLWLITPGEGIFWVLPEKYAPSTHAVMEKRGDLGTITLKDGIVVKGKVLDTANKPVKGVYVNADRGRGGEDEDAANFFSRHPVADHIRRAALTDDKGEFTFGPLSPGTYTVQPGEYSQDPSSDDRTRRPLADVFVSRKLVLKDGDKPEPLTIRASPTVLIEAQYYDSKGNKTRGHEVSVFGYVDKAWWHGESKKEADGKVVVRVPHGLEKTELSLSTNEHGSLRWRKSKDAPLQNDWRINLGTLNEDVKGIELIHYKAPVLLVKIVAKDGAKLKNLAITAVYPKGKGVHEGSFNPRTGQHSDVSFEEQDDGRLRSECLLPDEEVTLTAHAEGYRSEPVKYKLEEGTTKEIEIVVDKAPEKDPKKDKKEKED
jgi:protocatechuate 3,4-dioxygenase beta subunit